MIQRHGVRQGEASERRATIATNAGRDVPVDFIDLLRLESLADHHASAFHKNGHHADRGL